MRLKIAALVAGIAMMAASAWAGTVTINFSTCPSGQSCPGAIGTSQAYTLGGNTITAYGFARNAGGAFAATDLYVKQSGGDESGLGIAKEDDHEINTSQFIQLDLASLANAGITSGDLMIGSVQKGEGYSIHTSDQIGTLGALELNGTLDKTFFPISWTASDPIVGVTAYVPWRGNCDADVLVMNFSADGSSPTPEPASLALMGTGLLGLALIYLKRARSKSIREQVR